MNERAVKWGALLDREMKAASMTSQALANLLGVSHKTVWRWRSGKSIALIENAQQIAFELSQPALLRMAQVPRSKVCSLPDCGQPFIDIGRHARARYCSRKCQHTAHTRKRREKIDVQQQINTRRLRHKEETIRLFCMSCEPDGICRDAGCVIQERGDSPLKFVPKR